MPDEIHQPKQYSSLAPHVLCGLYMVVRTSALMLRVNTALVLYLTDRPP